MGLARLGPRDDTRAKSAAGVALVPPSRARVNDGCGPARPHQSSQHTMSVPLPPPRYHRFCERLVYVHTG